MSSAMSRMLGPKPKPYEVPPMSRIANNKWGGGGGSAPPPPPPPPPPLKPESWTQTSPGLSKSGKTPGASQKTVERSWEEVSSRRFSGSSEQRGTADPSTLMSPSESEPPSVSASRPPVPPPFPPTSTSSNLQQGGSSVKTFTSKDNSDLKATTERKSITGSVQEIVIDRNDVPFYDEEVCTSSEDEFTFTCCIPPYSPRYPPNPRPARPWDPSVLPAGTNIPTSIGRPCRRCGKFVYLAELHLSSRGAYHTECYKCCLCGKSLDSWSVAEYKGEVFCKGCYRRNFGTHGTGFGLGAGVLQTP